MNARWLKRCSLIPANISDRTLTLTPRPETPRDTPSRPSAIRILGFSEHESVEERRDAKVGEHRDGRGEGQGVAKNLSCKYCAPRPQLPARPLPQRRFDKRRHVLTLDNNVPTSRFAFLLRSNRRTNWLTETVCPICTPPLRRVSPLRPARGRNECSGTPVQSGRQVPPSATCSAPGKDVQQACDTRCSDGSRFPAATSSHHSGSVRSGQSPDGNDCASPRRRAPPTKAFRRLRQRPLKGYRTPPLAE